MFIDSDLGKIPNNWKIDLLENYVEFQRGVEPGSKNYVDKISENFIPFLRVGDLNSRESGTFIKEELAKNKIFNESDIALTLDGTVGIVKIGLKGAYSTGIRKLIITNSQINNSFLYSLVKSDHIQKIIKNHATGTTILHAGKSIKHMNFILPPKEIMNDFRKISHPIFNQLIKLKDENKKLTKLRDILLPKLMSGEIDVSKVEI